MTDIPQNQATQEVHAPVRPLLLAGSIALFLAIVSIFGASLQAEDVVITAAPGKPQARSLLFSTSSGIVLLQLFSGTDALEGQTNFFEQPRGGFLFGEQHTDPADILIPPENMPFGVLQTTMSTSRDLLFSTAEGVTLMSYNDTMLYPLSNAVNVRSSMLSGNRTTLFYTSQRDGGLILSREDLTCAETTDIPIPYSGIEDSSSTARRLLLLSPLEDFAIVIDNDATMYAYLVDFGQRKSTPLAELLHFPNTIITDVSFIDTYTIAISLPEGPDAGTYSYDLLTQEVTKIGAPSARILRSAGGKLVTLLPAELKDGLFANSVTIKRFTLDKETRAWKEEKTFTEKQKAFFRTLQLLEMKNGFFHQVTGKNYQVHDILNQQ